MSLFNINMTYPITKRTNTNNELEAVISRTNIYYYKNKKKIPNLFENH